MKIFNIIVLFVLFGNIVIAQTNCKNNVSTNYLAPTNNALPSNSAVYLNYFNWYPTIINAAGDTIPDNYTPDSMIVSGIPIYFAVIERLSKLEGKQMAL